MKLTVIADSGDSDFTLSDEQVQGIISDAAELPMTEDDFVAEAVGRNYLTLPERYERVLLSGFVPLEIEVVL
jgi:hypothetical protein